MNICSSILDEKLRRHHTLESLKHALVEAVDKFPMDVVHTAIDEWPNRLRRCIRANGGHFELPSVVHYISNKLCKIFSNQISS